MDNFCIIVELLSFFAFFRSSFLSAQVTKETKGNLVVILPHLSFLFLSMNEFSQNWVQRSSKISAKRIVCKALVFLLLWT